ncbi:hypothetical protein QC764_106175 [Podospora pseudoanserina]|uniref:Uncharacterized protein n=1 Tax=Podospora pseudoanserina TaxID=2609844 RepID=A0ABR0IM71_9PEZI|nr:hypothetical protein QC764_106175 [Podospora pseudoanserina]
MSSTFLSRSALSAIRPASNQPVTSLPSLRRLNCVTMGFDDVKRWKEWKAKELLVPNSQDNVFHLKIYSPINKSQVWNIDYSGVSTRPPPPPQQASARLLVSPLPAKVPVRRLRVPKQFLSYYYESPTGGGSSTPQRSFFSTTSQYITFETLKSVEKGGKVDSHSAKVKSSLRNRVQSRPNTDDAQVTGTPDNKQDKDVDAELPVLRYMPFFLGAGGPL